MSGSSNDSITTEASFYYCMHDLEELIEEYGASYVLEKCGISDMVLLKLYTALDSYFLYKNAKEPNK